MWNLILYNFGWNFLPNIGMFAIIVFFEYVWPTFFGCWMWTDVVVTIDLQPLDVVGRCYLPCGCVMADVFGTVADVIALLCLFVEDEKPHLNDIF